MSEWTTPQIGRSAVLKGRNGLVNLRSESASLFNTRLDELDQRAKYLPGSWVLTLSAQVANNAFVNDGANPRAVVPAVALVSMGCGGITVNFEIDVFPNASIQLPCDSVRVDLVWDRTLPDSFFTAGAAGWFQQPTEITVQGLLQRGNASGDARRTFLIPPYPALSAFAGPVPLLAKSVQHYLEPADANVNNSFVLQSTPFNNVNTPGVGNATQLRVDTTVVLAAVQQGQRYPVPGISQTWSVGGAAATTFPSIVDFEIST